MAKKQSTILIVKIILDIIMAISLLMLYQKMTISMSFHEIAGLVLFGLFLIHNLLNWKWIKSVTKKLFKKTTGFRLRISWIINALLFVSMAGIIITGLMISKTLPINFGKWFGAQQWHYFLAAMTIILMGIHLGLHWFFIKGITCKISFLPKKLSRTIGIFFLVVALVWGSFSIVTGSFTRWITGPFMVSSSPQIDNVGEHKGEIPEWKGKEKPSFGEDFTEFEKVHPEGENQGKGMNRGEGKEPGMKPGMGPGGNHNIGQSISIINILTIIATYGSEMIVFAFLTVLIFGRRKRQTASNIIQQ